MLAWTLSTGGGLSKMRGYTGLGYWVIKRVREDFCACWGKGSKKERVEIDCRSCEFPNILISPVAPIHFKCTRPCGFSCLCHFPGYLYSPALNSPACTATLKSACTRLPQTVLFQMHTDLQKV
ncbi:hypothetical protein QQF64_002197 [Cirrhinus molitorella]|uniref:Uncharacterized protein n=1 Tax=Cirrhinus molitorella TaxID=172907 RepID=A0ABR3MPH7_9TELE